MEKEYLVARHKAGYPHAWIRRLHSSYSLPSLEMYELYKVDKAFVALLQLKGLQMKIPQINDLTTWQKIPLKYLPEEMKE